MSQTTASLESHPIRAQFETLGEAITESLGADALPATVRPELLRSRSVLARLSFLLENADPAFVDDAVLTQAQSQTTNLESWTRAAAQGSDLSTNIASGLNALLPTIAHLTASLGPSTSTKNTQAATAFRAAVDAATQDLGSQCDLLVGAVAKLNAELVQRHAESAELAAQIAATRLDNQQLLTAAAQTFDTEKAALLKRADSELADRLTQIEAAAGQSILAINSRHEEHETQLRETAVRMSVIEADIKATAASISERALAGDYGQNAERERKTANRLRLGAVVSLASAAAFAIWAAVVAAKGDLTWQRLAAKLAVTVVFAGLATYLSQQSREHRTEERLARRRHLDLKALGPFIVDLPAEEQQAIRKELARRSFLEDRKESVAPPKPPRRGVALGDVKSIVEIVSAARK